MALANSLNLYLACEDMNFSWDERDVLKFERLWYQGKGIFEIAETLDRDPDEVALLVIDRARQKKIKPRQSGIWGEEYFELRKATENKQHERRRAKECSGLQPTD